MKRQRAASDTSLAVDPGPEVGPEPAGAGNAAAVQDLGGAGLAAGPSNALSFLSAVPGSPFASAADRYTADIARASRVADRLQDTADDVIGALVPMVVAARDKLDPDALSELGGRAIGAYGMLSGGQAALAELLARSPHQSLPGVPDGVALEQVALEMRRPELEARVAEAKAAIASAVTPHRFRGVEVAGQAVVVDLSGRPGAAGEAALWGELERSIALIGEVKAIEAQLAGPKGLDKPSLDAARASLVEWSRRPLDLAFLKAALGVFWDVLDATTPNEPTLSPKLGGSGPRPSDLLAEAEQQAAKTGWLGDIGKFDINLMPVLVDDHEGAQFALGQLFSADGETRPKLLEQLDRRGLLDKLCDSLEWSEVKELHDSIGERHTAMRAHLQRYFLTDDKWGTSLDAGWGAHISRQGAEAELMRLYRLSAEERTRALEGWAARGQLDSLCDELPWTEIKELHDGLAHGHGDVKTQLQGHFLGKRGYGPSLDSEWEDHDSSLASLVGSIPYAGGALNTVLDVATFGFNSAYGRALDDESRGITSKSQAGSARLHTYVRTAVIAAASLLTGGAADKMVRGAGAVVSGTRATLAGVAAGSVGATTGLLASDTYNVYVSHEQEGYSSLEDYAKTAFLGGALGGGMSRLMHGLGKAPGAGEGGKAQLPPGEAPPTPTQQTPPAPKPAGPAPKTRMDAAELLRTSEGKPGPSTNVGHAGEHIAPADVDPAYHSQFEPGKANNTVFRSSAQAEKVLRDILEANRGQIDALPADGTSTAGGRYPLSESMSGFHSEFGGAPAEVWFDEVTWRVARMPNGRLHLLHYSPRL